MWRRLVVCALMLGACDAVGTPIVGPAPAAPSGVLESDAGRPDAAASADAGPGDVPPGEHCAAASGWPAGWAAAEQWMYDELERRRSAAVFSCGGDEYRDLTPLSPSPALRCSARLHSLDMVQRDFRNIVNPDGERPPERMTQAGLRPNRWGELYESHRDPARALQDILDVNPYGCLLLTNPAYSRLGIGYYDGVFTLDLAEPLEP